MTDTDEPSTLRDISFILSNSCFVIFLKTYKP